MRPIPAFAAILLAAFAGATAEAGKMRVVEQALEVSPRSMTLPSHAGGILVVRTCERCPQYTLTAAPQTRYLLGERSVSLAELADYLRSRPNKAVTVMYRETTMTLTRVVVARPDVAP